MSQKQAIETFVVVVDGVEVTIEEGDLRDGTDPVVTDRPELWENPTGVAAYVDPDTGAVADVVNALIAAGLMASS